MRGDVHLDTVHTFSRGAESGDGRVSDGAPSLAVGVPGRERGQLTEVGVQAVVVQGDPAATRGLFFYLTE